MTASCHRLFSPQGSCRAQPHSGSRGRTAQRVVSLLLAITLSGLCASLQAQSSPPTPTSAGPADPTYDGLLDEAIDAFEAGEFARAHDLFAHAYELRPNARVLRGMGVAALRLDHYSEAYRLLKAALGHPAQPLTASQRDEVNGLLSWMETNLASVRLHWSPGEPGEYELLVDGSVLKENTLWLAPGTHRVTIHAPGFGALERTLTLAAEQHRVIDLTLGAREAGAPSASQPVAAAGPPARKGEAGSAPPAVAPADAARSLGSKRKTSQGAQLQRQAKAAHVAKARAHDHGSILERWWFWTVVGAVAAGGVTTAVLLSGSASSSAPVPSGEGVFQLPEPGAP